MGHPVCLSCAIHFQKNRKKNRDEQMLKHEKVKNFFVKSTRENSF